jgi:hypothetical protein
MADTEQNKKNIDELNDSLEDAKKLRDELLAKQKEGIKLTKEEIDLLEEKKKYIQDAAVAKGKERREEKKRQRSVEENFKTEHQSLKLENDIEQSISGQIGKLSQKEGLYKGLADAQKQSFKAATDIGTEMQAQFAMDEEKANLLTKTITGTSSLMSIQEEIAKLGPEDVEQRKALMDKYRTQLAAQEMDIAAKLESGEITEEEGKALRRILESQDAGLEKALQLSQVSKEQKAISEKQIAAYKKMREGIGAVLGTAQQLFSGFSGFVGTVLIGAGFVVNKLGASIKETGGFVEGVTVEASLLSFVFKDATANAKALTKELGGTEDVTLGAQIQTNVLANNLGISGQEAAALTGAFARLNEGSTSVAGDMMVATRELAKANGVIPSAAMSDLAQNTELFAKFGADGGKNIAEAAVFAQKLGSNLQSVSSVADALLDFDSSINSELELSALLGRQINLDRARALAFEGELDKAVQETVKQLGGVAEFERMNVIQRQEAAKALGISVGELEKMVKNMDNLNKEQNVFDKGLNKLQEGFTFLVTGPLGGMLKGLGGGITMLGQASMAAQGFGMNLGDVVKKTGSIAKSSFEAVKNFGKMAAQKLFGKGGMKEAFPGANVGRNAKGQFTKMGKKGVGDNLSKTTENAGDSVNNANKVKGGEGIGEKLKSLAEGLKAMGTPKVLFGAANLIPTALGFVAILPGIPGMLGVSLLGVGAGTGAGALGKGLSLMGTPNVLLGAAALAVAGVGFAAMTLGIPGMLGVSLLGVPASIGLSALAVGLTTFGTAAANPLVFLGIGALALLGAALIPTAYALGLAAPAISAFGDVIQGALSGLSSIVTAVANGLVSMLGVITLEKAAAMYMMAGALGVLGIALGGFAVALTAAAVGGLVGGGILKKIDELTEQTEPLQMTASAMQLLASSIQSISASLGTLSLEKLEALQDFKMNPVEMGVKAVSQGISGAVEKVSSLGGGGESVGTTGGVGDTQNQLIQRLDTLIQETRQNRDVYIDGTKVTSLITQTQERSTENRAGLQFA